jgi:hypothetical protein
LSTIRRRILASRAKKEHTSLLNNNQRLIAISSLYNLSLLAVRVFSVYVFRFPLRLTNISPRDFICSTSFGRKSIGCRQRSNDKDAKNPIRSSLRSVSHLGRSIDLPIYLSIHEWIDGSIDRSIDRSIDQLADGISRKFAAERCSYRLSSVVCVPLTIYASQTRECTWRHAAEAIKYPS